MFDPLGAEALGNHHDSSLDIEAQGHLGTALVVPLPNGYEHLVLQHGRTFQIHPKAGTEEKTNDALLDIFIKVFIFSILQC